MYIYILLIANLSVIKIKMSIKAIRYNKNCIKKRNLWPVQPIYASY